MISTALVNIAYLITNTVFLIFPTTTGFPTEVHTAFEFIGGYLYMLDPIVPIDTLVTTVSWIVTLELLIVGFRILEWTYRKIPIVGK